MSLYLAPDPAGERCLWQARPDADPRCVQRESDVDPITWSIVVLNVGMPPEVAS